MIVPQRRFVHFYTDLYLVATFAPMGTITDWWHLALVIAFAFTLLFAQWYIQRRMFMYYTAIYQLCAQISDRVDQSEENVGLAISALVCAVEELQKQTIWLPTIADHSSPLGRAGSSSATIPASTSSTNSGTMIGRVNIPTNRGSGNTTFATTSAP